MQTKRYIKGDIYYVYITDKTDKRREEDSSHFNIGTFLTYDKYSKNKKNWKRSKKHFVIKKFSINSFI